METLGHKHNSKPLMSWDKTMSKKHLAHRAEIKEMAKNADSPKKKIKMLKLSHEYNVNHAKEHREADKKTLKELAKEIKKEKKK